MTRRSAICLGMLLASASQARAQSVDYGLLEQLFGEPVTSSATGQPQRASDAPANMTIITPEEITRSGARTIPDVLRFVAGIDVRSYGVADAAVGIRGDNTAFNPRVLVLLDGRQVMQDDYGFTAWQLIPVALQDIRQIEIIKGPNSALYGFDAVSGVINIITYDALNDHVEAARVDAGNLDALDGEAVASTKIGNNVGVRLSATGSRSDEFGGNDATPDDRPRSGTLAAGLHARLSPRVDLLLSASIGSAQSAYYVDIGSDVAATFQNNSLRGKLSMDGATGLLSLDLYRNENRTTEVNELEREAWRQDVTVLKLADTLKLGHAHVVRAALEYRDNMVSSGEAFDGHLRYHTFAASLMWNWQATPRLAVTTALRVDHLHLSHDGAQFTLPGQEAGLFHDAWITAPSFNAGIVFKPTDLDTLRLLAARAIQLPSLVDLGIKVDGGSFISEGAPSLQPSDVLNGEIDWDRLLPRGIVLHSAAFIEYADRTIGSPFGSGFGILPTGQALLVARNFGGSRDLGGELTLKGEQPFGLRWSIGYALALVHDETSSDVLANASSVGYENQTPTHSVTAALGYTRGRFDFDLRARWQSQFLDYQAASDGLTSQLVRVPNYVTLTARLGYRLSRNLTLAVVGDQLGRASLTESAGLRVDRRAFASASLRF